MMMIGTSLSKRFWDKVILSQEKTSEALGFCWLWTANRDNNGYGGYYLSETGRNAKAHRVSYIALRGPIPPMLVLDHLCRVKHCVRPLHLEPITSQENARRNGIATTRTHCKSGHPFTEENVYYYANFGRPARRCQTCRLLYRQARKNSDA